MPMFTINPAASASYEVEARSIDAAKECIVRTGKRNVFGVERSDRTGRAKFYLDRGTGPLWPISVTAASVELSMGGF